MAAGLNLAGLAPIAAAALASWTDLPQIDPVYFSLSYGAVLLAFMAGARWRENVVGAPAALAGFAAMLLPAIPALCLLIAGFLAQALGDLSARTPSWTGTLRMSVTAGVVVALLAVLARQLI